ncbi:MAG: hypothetical protein Q7R44_00450 [bacterium]|nr:hypothetical protein [bacterium]
MERFRQINLKDKGIKLLNAVVSVAKKFDQEVSWDLFESQKTIKIPLPKEIDLEAEKALITHIEECWVGNTRVMIRESLRLEPVMGGFGTFSPALARSMQLECQFCEGCSPNLLQQPHLKEVRKDLLTLGNAQREKAKQKWMKKQGVNL